MGNRAVVRGRGVSLFGPVPDPPAACGERPEPGGASAGRGAGTRVNHPARRRALPAPDAERGGGRRGHALGGRGGYEGRERSRGSARLCWVVRALVCK